MGDDRNPAGSCFSYVGRVQGKNQGKGQLVNLGMPRCLSIGIILHETLQRGGRPMFMVRLALAALSVGNNGANLFIGNTDM